MEIRRVLAKHPNQINLKDFILNFHATGAKTNAPDDEDLEAKMARSKSAWAALLKTPIK